MQPGLKGREGRTEKPLRGDAGGAGGARYPVAGNIGYHGEDETDEEGKRKRWRAYWR